jgi:hypothetical protein
MILPHVLVALAALSNSIEGKVIFQDGDVTTQGRVTSARKSILALLYGKYVVTGRSTWMPRWSNLA